MKPNNLYEHVYAIIRIDDFLGEDVPIDHKITIKKIVHSAEIAKAEVTRLNELQGRDGVRYFFQVSRLEKSESATPRPRVGALPGVVAKAEEPEKIARPQPPPTPTRGTAEEAALGGTAQPPAATNALAQAEHEQGA
jgi:hypothetical protein